MPLSYKAPLFAAEPVLHQKGFVASIAAFGKAPRAQAMANGEVVLELLPRQLRTVKAIGDGR
jgi:hypothetical protein